MFIDKSIIHRLWGCSFVDWTFLFSSGASDGVFVVWDNEVLELVEECVGISSVACSFKNIDDG